MRPTAKPQSSLKAPLNQILGTEANVRVLRVLSGLSSPISAPELARRSDLQRSSVHRVIKALEEIGIVQYVGTAAHAQIAMRDGSALARPIRQLFQAEQARYDELLVAVKHAAGSIDPPPLAVWLQGPDKPGDPLLLTVVEKGRRLDQSAEMMRELVERIERRFDVQVEVQGKTHADLDALSNEDSEYLLDAVPLLGVPPGGVLTRYRDLWRARNIRTHLDHDRRALEYGRALADAIKRDPALITDARKYLARRWRAASLAERKELAEWKRILATASPARLRRILTDPGERSTRLRQTIPFIGVFSPERPVRL